MFSHHYGGPAAVQARWHNGTWRAARLPSGLSGVLGAVSADAAKDAWAVSAQTGYALHWNGTKWSVAKRWHEPSTLPRELTGVTAFSPTNVWVFGGPGAFPGLGTWHFNGHNWQHVMSAPANGTVQASALSATNRTRMSLPWLVNPVGLAPDGSGGLWITAFSNSALFAIHRSATGTWSRVKIGPNASVIRITLISGSTSLWGAGAVKTASGVNAAVWAHGRLP